MVSDEQLKKNKYRRKKVMIKVKCLEFVIILI